MAILLIDRVHDKNLFKNNIFNYMSLDENA